MKVILHADVKKVGRKNDVADVSKGYALNYLIPQKLAEVATMPALSAVEKKREQSAAKEAERVQALRTALEPLVKTGLTLTAPVNEKGHLFAAIHTADVAAALTEKIGVEVPESSVLLDKDVKEVGEHTARIAVGEEEIPLPITITADTEAPATA
ncbi:MAG: 50S ribosomal protein L9 [Candidatus Paceibacterota bacterium]